MFDRHTQHHSTKGIRQLRANGTPIAPRSRVMDYCSKIALLTLSVISVSAESPHMYTGHVVNAKCWPAAEIISRNSRGYSPSAGINTFVGTHQKALNLGRLKKAIVRLCSINAGVTEFALLDTNGNFFLLDEPGNWQVFEREVRRSNDVVTIEGSVDRATLHVTSLTKR